MYLYFLVDSNGYIKGRCGCSRPKDAGLDNIIEDDDTDRSNDMWDLITKSWKPDDRPLPDVVRQIDKIDFIELFTDTEMEDLIDFAKTNKKAALFLRKLDSYDVVNLNLARLQTAINEMETVGVIGAGRASEIINSTSDLITVIQPPRK